MDVSRQLFLSRTKRLQQLAENNSLDMIHLVDVDVDDSCANTLRLQNTNV